MVYRIDAIAQHVEVHVVERHAARAPGASSR